jgi:hypothetical protein
MEPRARRRLRKDLIMAIVSVMLAVGFNMYFTIRVANNNNHQWCGLLVLLDDRNQKAPPTNDPDTNQFRNEIHSLRTGYNC